MRHPHHSQEIHHSLEMRLWESLKNCPTTSGRMGCLSRYSWKGVSEKAFTKDSDLVQQAREAYCRTSHPDFNHEVPHNLAGLLQDMIISAGLLDSTIYEIQEIWTGWENLQYPNECPEEFAKEYAVLLPCIPFGIAKSHGPKIGPSPWYPLPFCQFNLLPLVWQRRPKWRNCGQPLANNALQAGASSQPMPPLLLDQLGGHTVSWPRLQTAQGKWCQRGRQGSWQHIRVKLTDPNCPLQPEHYLPRSWWCEHFKIIIL